MSAIAITRRLLRLPLLPLCPAWRWLLAILRDLYRQVAGPQAARRREARRIAHTVIAELARQRISSTELLASGKRRKRKRRRVSFSEPLLLTPDEVWMPVNLKQLPSGITSARLKEDEVIESIQDRLNKHTRIDYLATGELCYVVGMRSNRFPEKFSINAVETPANAPPLVVPFGVNGDGDVLLVDLLDLKHLLVAGATGGGKTTLHHSIITTLISRNTEHDVELWLIDLKRTEFNLYRPLTGRREEGGIVRRIASDPYEAVDLLSDARRELDERNKLMALHRCTSLDDLARSRGIKLKRIVLIIDEFALLTTSLEKIGKQNLGNVAKTFMGQLASVGRSGGMSIIIATQAVNKDIVDSFIRANFENRICFSTADWRQSQLIVESSEADGLPPGRAILRREGKTIEVQTCYITPRQVRIEVDRIAAYGPDGGLGESEHVRFVREAQIMISVASQHYHGELTRIKILSHEGIKGVISRDRFDEIMRRLERDGVVTAGGHNKARRVAPGFFGRPGLLDALYGILPLTSQADPNDGPATHWDGIGKDNAPRPAEPDTAGSKMAQLDIGMVTDTPAPPPDEPPPAFRDLISFLGDDAAKPPAATPPSSPKPRKRRKSDGSDDDKVNKDHH